MFFARKFLCACRGGAASSFWSIPAGDSHPWGHPLGACRASAPRCLRLLSQHTLPCRLIGFFAQPFELGGSGWRLRLWDRLANLGSGDVVLKVRAIDINGPTWNVRQLTAEPQPSHERSRTAQNSACLLVR